MDRVRQKNCRYTRAFTCILFDLPEVIDDLSWLRDKDCLFGGPGPGVKETLSPRLLLALLLRFALQDKIGSFRSAPIPM